MSGLEVLRQYRDEILKVEVGILFILIFDKKKFWKDKFNIDISESYFQNKILNFKKFEINLGLIKKGKEADFWQKLYTQIENLNSMLDKSLITSGKYFRKTNFLTNAFGSYRDDKILAKSLKFQHILDDIYSDNFTDTSVLELKRTLEKNFQEVLADDRFPINEISLWDQTYTTTSLFKAILTQLLMDEKIYRKYQNNISFIQWCILGIQYNKRSLIEKSLKSPSIRWYRNTINEIDEEIKKLIEVDYPLGNEIYRDETGIYFIVGEGIENFKDFIEQKIDCIFKKHLQGEIYPYIAFSRPSRGLTNLSTLIEQAKEGFLKYSRKSLELWKLNKCKLQNSLCNSVGICPICQIRFITEKDREKRNKPPICEICDERIHHKSVEKWLENLQEETIWMDEIKDKNNKVAYVTLKFELLEWLSGNLVNSFIILNLNNFSKLLADLKKIILYDRSRGFHYNEKGIHVVFGKKEKLTYPSPENLLFTFLKGTKWEDFIKSSPLGEKIDWESETIKWEEFKDINDPALDLLATLILQFLLRKNPSPARLRRIWESTKGFFEEIHQDLDNILEIPKWRRTSFFWTLNGDGKFENIKPTGEELEDEKGLLYWVQPNERKVYLISNIRDFLLQYGDDKIKNLLRNLDKATTFEEARKINEDLDQLLLGNVKDYLEDVEVSLHKIGENQKVLELSIKKNIKISQYKPYSLITDTSPTNYQVIIPAEYLPKFIDVVLERYDEHFKYVYGKLPLHIGIVVSRYDSPVYVNLQALRRIRRDVKDTNRLWVKKKKEALKTLLKEKLLNLIKKKDEALYENLKAKPLMEILQEIKQHTSLEDLMYEAMNDTYKYYSLYFDNTDEKDYNFYIKPDKNWKHWISTIDKFPQNGKVKIIPNTFDFEYLDHNIRRNEIFYAENGRRIPYLKSNRPYELETHWWKFKKFRELIKDTNLPSSRLHKLVEVLYNHLLEVQSLENPDRESRSYSLFAEFVNWLELQKEEKRRELIKDIFDLPTAEWELFKENLREALTKEENVKLFVDMFDFWHNLLEEV